MDEEYPRFFIEETSFQLGATPPPDILEQHLQNLIDIIEACREKGEDITRSADLFEVDVFPGVPFHKLLFESFLGSPLDPILRRNLQVALFRCVEWDRRLDPEPEPTIEVGGGPCTAAMVAVVHALAGEAHGAACLCLGARSDRSGVLPVRSGGEVRELYFLTRRSMLPGFYRSLFELEDHDADAYMGNAAHAFPDLAFAPRLASQFSRFDTRYRDVRPMVTVHLSVLNDHFAEIFQVSGAEPIKVIAALGSHHVEASPESPNTRADKKAMREREVNVDHVIVAGRKVPVTVGRPIRCEWHTKIWPNTDRIYFHPGDKSVADGRPFIGIFHAHLK